MKQKKERKTKWIWLFVLILVVCIVATTVAVVDRLNAFVVDDSGALPLIPEQNTTETTLSPTSSTTATSATQPPKKPGFEAADDKGKWSNQTQREIFRVSYEDGEQVVTVQSADGDNLIAPGTENSYIFKLKNTGNVALDYTLEMDAYVTPNDTPLPIQSRLDRYDGKWVLGGKDSYANVSALDAAEDRATLGAGKYTYYTLNWVWPFDGDDNALDTQLGNLAETQDLVFTIVIKTVATESENPYDDSGLSSPQTGDNAGVALWGVLAVCSLVMMFVLFVCRRKEERDNAEAETVENR